MGFGAVATGGGIGISAVAFGPQDPEPDLAAERLAVCRARLECERQMFGGEGQPSRVPD